MYFNIKEPQFPYHLIASNLPGKNPKGDPLCFVFPHPFPLIYQQALLTLLQIWARLIPKYVQWITASPCSKPSTSFPLHWDIIQALLHVRVAFVSLPRLPHPQPHLASFLRTLFSPQSSSTRNLLNSFLPLGMFYPFPYAWNLHDIKYMSGSNATIKKDFHHLI